MRKLMKSRTYDNFLQISKMDLNADDVAVTKDEVKRYGVVLKRPLAKNSGRELDKFFYYYFKVSPSNSGTVLSIKRKSS